jgi:glycosyltransferase involved in cell wall biosynthesis
MTRVSVGLPVYNAEAYLDTALSTLVAQTHEDLEIIISDNASTDSTRQICEDYAARDARIRYHRQPTNRGGSFNHNFVASRATAPYFRWYAADDWMAPGCIENCARVLDQNPDVVLAWARPIPMRDGQPIVEYPVEPMWDDSTASARLRSLIGPPHAQSLISECYPIYGVARTEPFLSCLPLGSFYGSDNVVLVGMALKGHWRELPPGLFYCRRHASSSTSGRNRFEVARWMDPARRPGRSMPETSRFIGYARAVAKTDLPWRERLRCAWLVLRWPATHQHWRLMLWDVRVFTRDVVTSLRDRDSASG